METGSLIALITGITSLVGTLGLGLMDVARSKREASANVSKSSIEASPAILEVLRKANEQEFTIMRELNKDLKDRVAELEGEVELYKELYNEIKMLYEDLERKYREITGGKDES